MLLVSCSSLTDKSSVEKREAGLKENLARVNTDKTKIEKTIGELDRYKREALHTTWEKVNGCVNSSLFVQKVD